MQDFQSFLHKQKNILLNQTFVIYFKFWNGNQIKPHIKIQMFKEYNLPVLVCT